MLTKIPKSLPCAFACHSIELSRVSWQKLDRARLAYSHPFLKTDDCFVIAPGCLTEPEDCGFRSAQLCLSRFFDRDIRGLTERERIYRL